ncbi:MAG: hypothetical protein ABW066_07210 [Sedimenticola sp.]
MTNSSNPFLLPKGTTPAEGDDSFTPHVFEEWVQGLPTGNVGQTAKELYMKLRQMNSVEIPPTDRLHMLVMLDQSLQFVLQTLAEHYLQEPPPLSRRNKSASELVLSLCTLVVQAYKLALNQFHHESLAGRVLHKSGRTDAIHKVLYYLGQILLRSYQLYHPAPKWLWHEVHGIYSYASEHNLHEKPLENEDPRVGQLQTATSLYKQTLLLSLSGPYRMMRGEVGRVYMALQRWAQMSNLVELGKADADTGLFVVDGKSDEAPRYRGLGDDKQIERGWVLDTLGLAGHLAEELEEMKGSSDLVGSSRPVDGLDVVSPELLERLMLSWGIGVTRASERTESSGDVLLHGSIENIFTLLGGELIQGDRYRVEDITPQDEEEKEEEAYHPEFDEHVVDGGFRLDSFKESSGAAAKAERKSPVEIIDTRDEDILEKSRDCWVIDESMNGYHLGWYGSGRVPVHVGQLVGVQKRISGLLGELQVGVIRWQMSENDETIDFGVELYQDDTQPVLVKRDRGDGSEEIIPGLLQSSPGGGSSLIMAPFFATENDRLTLVHVHGVGEKAVKLNKVLDGSASFVQVSFQDAKVKRAAAKPAGDETAAAQETQAATEEEFDFEELWDQF